MYTPTRPIMTAVELAEHATAAYGRNYLESDDGYSDLEAEERRGWTAMANWGRDGWDLGTWPYVILYTRDIATCTSCGANLTDGSGDGTNGHWPDCTSTAGRFGLLQICEGDRTAWAFASVEDRNAALDYLFLYYAADKPWAPLTWEDRPRLDAGQLTVEDRFRGPYRDK